MRRLRFGLAGDGTLLQELTGTRRGTVADIAGLETLFEVKDVFGDLAENILHCAVGVFLIVETQDGSVVASKLGWNVTSKETKTMKFDVPIEKPQLDKLSLI